MIMRALVLFLGLVFASTAVFAGDEQGTITVSGIERSYFAYVPDHLPPNAPLLFALHGTGGDGARMRAVTGGEFDRLADTKGFVALYPTGYKNTWDDCRKTDPSAAKQQKIDDIGFFRALIAQFHDKHGIDPHRVFIVGYSNGAQMAMRVALEAPDMVAAIAAVSANLPVAENSVCHPIGQPVAALLMDGTADPVNPFKGGEVNLGRSGSRGVVTSAPATADYWATLAGYVGEAEITQLPHRDPADPTSVTISDWHEAGKKNVVFYAIAGGGHVVPNPRFVFPTMLGSATKDIDAPAEIWNFFASTAKPDAR
jgi:polyhydroxybutyrate depolymerase